LLDYYSCAISPKINDKNSKSKKSSFDGIFIEKNSLRQSKINKNMAANPDKDNYIQRLNCKFHMFSNN